MAKAKSSFAVFVIRIFFITLVLSAGISIISQYLTNKISVQFAFLVLFIIMFIGVIFDTIGIAVAACDNVAFVSMAAKRDKSAKRAIILLKNAPKVTSFCSDVIGDICGIVSGAIGTAIVAKIILINESFNEFSWIIGISAVIAAFTVAIKAVGKNMALKNSKWIVGAISKVLSPFWRVK